MPTALTPAESSSFGTAADLAREGPVNRAKQTAIFLAIALGGSYAIGAVWVARPETWWLSQFLMWTPGVAALVVQRIRRELPRALGFRFTGVGPWLAAYFYPLVVVAACVGLAYAVRGITGLEVIQLQAASVRSEVLGVEASGLVPVLLVRRWRSSGG